MTSTSTVEQSSLFFKIVLIGQSGVGKTNILSRYINNKFFVASTTTIGVQFSTKTIQMHGRDIKIALWDTCGQEKYRALASIFYKGAVGACIIFDLGSKQTFLSLPKWLKQLVQQTPNGVIRLLIGNKCDLQSREVTTEQALKFAQQNKMAYIETSAAKGININTAFEKLIQQIYQNFKKSSQLTPKVLPPKININNPVENASEQKKKRKCC